MVGLVFFIFLICGLGICEESHAGSAVKIGLVTDTHFDRVTYPERAEVAKKIVDVFNAQKVDIILSLGDMYEGNYKGLQDYLDDKNLYEEPWLGAAAPVYWTLGNHDNWGVRDHQYIANCRFMEARNYTVDLPGGWRLVIYANCDGHYFSSNPTDLIWLSNILDRAREEKKKIMIAAHVRIDQDYPGNPPSFTTANTYSAFSFNAADQRGIIEKAKDDGADIRYVFHGHVHKSVRASVHGIEYYIFKNTGSDGSAAIIEILDNDSLIVNGLGLQESYK